MELLDATDEGFGEVAGVLLEANSGVAEAQAGCRIGDGHATAAAARSAGGAVRWDEFDFLEDGGLFVHENFLSGEWRRSKMGIVWVHPRSFFEECETKGVRGYGTWKNIRKTEGKVESRIRGKRRRQEETERVEKRQRSNAEMANQD